MKAVREGNVVSLPRQDGVTVDVFTGKGWENHTVFEIIPDKDGGKGKKIRLLRGHALSMEDFQTFKKRV